MEDKMINIVLEYWDGGDLAKHIKAQNKKHLNEKDIWKFFIQACLGLQYLHTRKILHRDIKTMNLFLMKDGAVKIGDLGVAKSLQKVNFAHTMVGTPYYLSPELIEEKAYDHKSDIWSLGWVLYELWALDYPFRGTTQATLLMKIIKGKYDPIPVKYSKDLSELISKCLRKDTRKRLSIHQILEEDSVKRKARELNITIPNKEDILKRFDTQRNEVINKIIVEKSDHDLGLIGSAPKKKTKKGLKTKSGTSKNPISDQKQKKSEYLKALEEKKEELEDLLMKQSSTKLNYRDSLSSMEDPQIVKGKSQDLNKTKTATSKSMKKGNATTKGIHSASPMKSRKSIKQKTIKMKKKEVKDVENLPDLPNNEDDGYNEKEEVKSASQLLAEMKASKASKKNSLLYPEEAKKAKLEERKKATLKKESKSTAVTTKTRAGQQKISDADFDDLLTGKSSKTKKNDDDELEAMLFSKPSQEESKSGFSSYVQDSKKDEPEEENEDHSDEEAEEDEEGKDFDDDDDLFNDRFSDDDMITAYNFTDTDFDVNNRIGFDMNVDTEFNRSLDSIPEDDEETEEEKQRKKLEMEIKAHETRIKEAETEQKQKWNHILQYCNHDKKKADDWYQYASKKESEQDEELEDLSSEIQNYVEKAGVEHYENMAFELFWYIIKETDIKDLKDDLEAVKERLELI